MGEVIRLRVASSEEPITLQSASGSLAVEAVSPRVSFEKVEGGTRLDITDIDGTKSAILPDGATGQTGPAGETGPQGEPGPQGVGIKRVWWSNYSLNIELTDGTICLPYYLRGEKGEQGDNGSDGVTFTPSVSSDGTLSWTNDGGRQNPMSVNIKGPQGPQGMQGLRGPGIVGVELLSDYTLKINYQGGGYDIVGPIRGPQGEAGTNGTDGADGVTFTPSVSSEGVLSWTNDGGRTNPQSVNIKGPQGEPGDDYTLTSEDKYEIAGLAITPTAFPAVAVQTAGRVINYSTGSVNVRSGYNASKFVDISAYPAIRYSRAKTAFDTMFAGIAFYDAEQTFITGTGIPSLINQSALGYVLHDVAVPTGAKYARFTMFADTQTYGAFELYGIPTAMWKLEHKQDALTFDSAPTSGSTNPVTSGGVYTALQSKADSVTVETVSGTDPVITGVDNHRYVCGTVDTLTLTPPSSGIVDVVFTSGTTPTVLSVPNTVKWPGWFDPTSLDESTTYEINIMDGVYGAVGVWT